MDLGKISKYLGTKREWLREFFAEFIGTFLIVFLGNSSVASMVFGTVPELGAPRSVTSVHLAYGFAVTMGIFASIGVSGAHLNPAVTLAMVVVGKFPWRKTLHYWAGQYLGAFAAAAGTYFVYYDALNKFDGGVRAVSGSLSTAGIWTTYPAGYLTIWGGLFDQVVGTFILLLVICAITDSRNTEVSKNQVAIYVGILVITIGIALGFNCGYAINPARDLSPRIFLALFGWGSEAFTVGKFPFWWIPILGPHIGAILGTLCYVFMVEIHHPPKEVETESFEGEPKRIQVIAAAKQ